jgi:RNA polymerase sigma-70 factor (ECF subfamily)
MSEISSKSRQIQGWIERLRAGDESARQELLACTYERLREITRKALHRYPRVRRWEQTDDVLQNVCLRLDRTLREVTPEDARAFLRLASLNIRRELLDLIKHYYGPRGQGAKHATNAGPPDESAPPDGRLQVADVAGEPARLAAWSEFHQAVERLPNEEREAFDLLWYQGLTQAEAAEVLGVAERTVKRRWQAARLHLFEALHGELPPGE